MADIVNFRRARKQKVRREHEAQAAANRRRFGRSRVEKQLVEDAKTRAKGALDGKRLDPEESR